MAATNERLAIQGPVQFLRLNEVEFHIRGNHHGQLKVRGYISAEYADSLDISEQRFFLLDKGDEVNSMPIFSGISHEFLLKREGESYNVEIIVFTGTFKLDAKRKSRSFQDVSMTYRQVINEVLCGTPGAYADFTVIADKVIGEPKIQYEETDWEFMKRLASELGTQLIPDCMTPEPHFSFGPTVYSDKFLKADEYTITLDKRYYELGGKDAGLYKPDFLCYQMKSSKYRRLGSQVKVFNQQLFVCSQRGKLEKGELIFTYKLGRAGLFGERFMHNKKLSGLSLEGKVVNTKNETVEMALNIDEGRQGITYPFPWAPETGNIMYCMPTIGTNAMLYLADGSTKNAVVINSPRTNGDTCEAMGDIQNRCFVTEHGKQLCLYPEKMILAAGMPADSSPIQVLMDQLSGFTMESPKAIRIVGKMNVRIQGFKVNFSTPLEMKTLCSVSEAKRKGTLLVAKGSISGNPPTGGGDGSLTLQYQFDALGAEGILCGMEFATYEKFDDAPQDFDFAGWMANIVLGAAIAVVCVVAAVVIIGVTGGVGLAAVACIGAAVGAAVTTASIAYDDYQDGNVRDWKVAATQVLCGAAVGALTSTYGAMAAPFITNLGVAASVGVVGGAGFRTQMALGWKNQSTSEKLGYIYHPFSIATDAALGVVLQGISNTIKYGTYNPTPQQVRLQDSVTSTAPKTPASSGSGKYLDKPATNNGTLNVGAGKNPIEGAYNIDINPGANGVHIGDATNLSNISTGSQSKVIMQNPYKYDALNSEVYRVLDKGGTVQITGGMSNKWFNRIFKLSETELLDMGYSLISKGEAEIAEIAYTTNGETIKSTIMEVILKKN